MFGKPVTLVRAFGIPIRADLSWIVLAVLITWSAARWFGSPPISIASPAVRWTMAAFAAAGLFASIVVHELSHALVARSRGIPIKGITLFVFGGVAEMEDEPKDARGEFTMAVVGPLTSIGLALLLFLARAVTGDALPAPVSEVVRWLAAINLTLGVFNLLPAFPLDGGRVLRSALWARTKDLRWATRVASAIGVGFGTAFMVLGVLLVFLSPTLALNGIWTFLIGMFLRMAAATPYRQLLVRQALEGEPVRRFMIPTPVTVPRSIPVQELVEHYIYRHHFKMFPVMDEGRLVGCVSLDQVKRLPREEWDSTSVGALATPCSPDNTIAPDADAVAALQKMSRTGASRLMVVDGGTLVGIIALRDLLSFLSLKMELEKG